jgi:hypothetical protein
MLPQCRYFLICQNGHRTSPGEQVTLTRADGEVEVLVEPTGRHEVLVNPVIALGPSPGQRYPGVFERLYLYAQMSGGNGLHRLSIELLRWYQGQTYPVFRTPETPTQFGTDRAKTNTFRVRLAPIVFPTAGQYPFRLLCNGTEIGCAEIELLEPQ